MNVKNVTRLFPRVSNEKSIYVFEIVIGPRMVLACWN